MEKGVANFAPAAAPAADSALLQELAKHDRISFDAVEKGTYRWQHNWRFLVTSESGELIAKIKFFTENAKQQVCNAQVIAHSGILLASFETPGLKALRDSVDSQQSNIAVTVQSNVYATCTTKITKSMGRITPQGVNSTVSRADGSGGTILQPVDSGSLKTLVILGTVTWLCVIGVFIMGYVLLRACCIPFFGKASSLDGSKAYPPHTIRNNTETLHFVPLENDKRKGTYAEVDSLTKLDLFIAMTVAKTMGDLGVTLKEE